MNLEKNEPTNVILRKFEIGFKGEKKKTVQLMKNNCYDKTSHFYCMGRYKPIEVDNN